MVAKKNTRSEKVHRQREAELGFSFPRAVTPIGPVTQARAREIARRLAGAYSVQQRDARETFLDFSNPYECVVAVALSAQTTDKNVNKVLPDLFGRWPDSTTLAQASQTELEESIHSLGFYRQKARNLRAMAAIVMDDYGGEIPANMADLLRLPGVARKTANIVLAESFGVVQGIAVDTHVYRIGTRLGLTRAKTPAAAEGDLCKAFDYTDWYHINHAMVAFGREICDARRPLCEQCLLRDLCPSAGKEVGVA